MKRLLLAIAIVLFACTSVQAQHFAGLKITKYTISSIWPSSFRSIKGSVSLTVDNTGEQRTVSRIEAVAYRGDKPFVQGYCDDVTFFKGLRTYVISGEVSLCSGVSIWEAIGAALSFNAAEYTVDVHLVMTHEDGRKEVVDKIAIPVSRFVH